MKTFIQDGNAVTVTAPAGGILSGAGLLIGSIFGVAAFSAAAGAQVELVLVGVFALPNAGDEFAVGDPVYWDDTAKEVTTTATDNVAIGVCTRAAGAGDATVHVRLDAVSVG